MHRILRTGLVLVSLTLVAACGQAVKRSAGEPISKKNVVAGVPGDFPAIALPPGATKVHTEAGVRHVFFATEESVGRTVGYFSAELAKPGAHVGMPQTFPDGSVAIRQIVGGTFNIVYISKSATERFDPALGLGGTVVDIFYSVEPPPSLQDTAPSPAPSSAR